MSSKKRINIKNFAKKIGLSVTSVSRALNGHSNISTKTKVKIIKAAEKYNYYPNLNARRLASKKPDTIAFITTISPHGQDYVLLEFLAGLTQGVKNKSTELIFKFFTNEKDEFNYYQKLIDAEIVDYVSGVLLRLDAGEHGSIVFQHVVRFGWSSIDHCDELTKDDELVRRIVDNESEQCARDLCFSQLSSRLEQRYEQANTTRICNQVSIFNTQCEAMERTSRRFLREILLARLQEFDQLRDATCLGNLLLVVGVGCKTPQRPCGIAVDILVVVDERNQQWNGTTARHAGLVSCVIE